VSVIEVLFALVIVHAFFRVRYQEGSLQNVDEKEVSMQNVGRITGYCLEDGSGWEVASTKKIGGEFSRMDQE